VGADAEVVFDTRIVAATNRDLDVEVRERRFREDLYYRVNVVHVHMPPLRERENDVLLLSQAFLQRSNAKGASGVVGLKSAAADKLTSYPWPGNVRELQNCIERAVALAQFDRIGVDDLPERIANYRSDHVDVDALPPGTPLLTMDEVERRYVTHVLQVLGGRKATAARVLGMDRRTLYRKLERWEQEAAATSSERAA
jgi:two-component system response regulator HydG